MVKIIRTGTKVTHPLKDSRKNIRLFLICLFLLCTGCTHTYDGFSDRKIGYYSVVQVYAEIDENPDDIVNKSRDGVIAIHMQGYLLEMNSGNNTFVLTDSDHNNELKCCFETDNVNFYNHHAPDDWIRLEGRVMEDDSGYYFLVHDIEN